MAPRAVSEVTVSSKAAEPFRSGIKLQPSPCPGVGQLAEDAWQYAWDRLSYPGGHRYSGSCDVYKTNSARLMLCRSGRLRPRSTRLVACVLDELRQSPRSNQYRIGMNVLGLKDPWGRPYFVFEVGGASNRPSIPCKQDDIASTGRRRTRAGSSMRGLRSSFRCIKPVRGVSSSVDRASAPGLLTASRS